MIQCTSWPFSNHLRSCFYLSGCFLFSIFTSHLEFVSSYFHFSCGATPTTHNSAELFCSQTSIIPQVPQSGDHSPSDQISWGSYHYRNHTIPQPSNLQLSSFRFLYFFCVAGIKTFLVLLLLALISRLSSSPLSTGSLIWHSMWSDPWSSIWETSSAFSCLIQLKCGSLGFTRYNSSSTVTHRFYIDLLGAYS